MWLVKTIIMRFVAKKLITQSACHISWFLNKLPFLSLTHSEKEGDRETQRKSLQNLYHNNLTPKAQTCLGTHSFSTKLSNTHHQSQVKRCANNCYIMYEYICLYLYIVLWSMYNVKVTSSKQKNKTTTYLAKHKHNQMYEWPAHPNKMVKVNQHNQTHYM